MKKTLETYRQAREAAYTAEKLPRQNGNIKRIAAAAGYVAGRRGVKTLEAERKAFSGRNSEYLEDALADARGVNRVLASTIAELDKKSEFGPKSNIGPNTDGVVGRNWLAVVIAKGEPTHERGLFKPKEMIAPAMLSFGDQKIEVRALSMSLTHTDNGEVTSRIFINQHSGEVLPEAFEPRIDPDDEVKEPKLAFGNEFRINIGPDGVIEMMRSSNMVGGFSDLNRVSFETQEQAAANVTGLLQQTTQLVHEQALFDGMTRPQT